MKKFFSRFDWVIFSNLLILLVLGLMAIGSVNSEFFLSQLTYVLLGLGLFFLLANFDYRAFFKLGKIFFSFSLLALILTFVFGAVTRGSIRWIQIGRFTLQPSELVKPFLILSFASFLISQPITKVKSLLRNIFFLALPVLLIFLQPDLGSSLVVVLFLAGDGSSGWDSPAFVVYCWAGDDRSFTLKLVFFTGLSKSKNQYFS